MSVSEIKNQLHKAIDAIDNKEFLEAMLVIVTSGKESSYDQTLDEEQLNILREREGKYLSGKDKGKSIEELKAKMNKKYGL